jgi:hypothetical protein
MSQERFFEMLKRVPTINLLWDEEKKEIDVDRFELALGVMSSGERHMALFFASIWFHSNRRYGFDLVDAVQCVGLHDRDMIIEWITDPFYP